MTREKVRKEIEAQPVAPDPDEITRIDTEWNWAQVNKNLMVWFAGPNRAPVRIRVIFVDPDAHGHWRATQVQVGNGMIHRLNYDADDRVPSGLPGWVVKAVIRAMPGTLGEENQSNEGVPHQNRRPGGDRQTT